MSSRTEGRLRLYGRAYAGIALLVTAATCVCVWRVLSCRTSAYWAGAAVPDVQAQLNWIGGALHRGGGGAQNWYPEGFFFEHAVYGMALVNQALWDRRDAALARRNAVEVEWTLTRLESDAGRAPFPRGQAIEHGVFYAGWLNRMIGGLLLIQPVRDRRSERVAQFHRLSREIADAFAASKTGYLEAYPGKCWPVDNVVALTSLRLHDDLYGTRLGITVDRWVARRAEQLGKAVGLLPHHVDAVSGDVIEGPRGSSLGLALAFLPELDERFAREQYRRYRRVFGAPTLDFVPIREYPAGRAGHGDVDSGPMVGSLGVVATGISIAASRANGDQEVFERAVQMLELFGAPITTGGRKRYLLGAAPVCDAFVVWGKTMAPWRTAKATYGQEPMSRLTPTGNPWTIGLACGLCVLLWTPVLITRLRRRRVAPGPV